MFSPSLKQTFNYACSRLNFFHSSRLPQLPLLFAVAAMALMLTDWRAAGRVAEPQQTNLLQNSGFENGAVGLALTSVPGWTVTRGTVDVLPNSPADPLGVWQQSAEGGKSLDLIGTPGVGTIRQSFSTEAGRKYIFSGWVAHHYGTPEAGANVYVNGAQLTPLYHNTPNQQYDLKWARFTRDFTAASTSTTLVLEDRNLAGYEYGGTLLDGLSVVPDAPIAGVTVLDQRTTASVSTTTCATPTAKTVFAATDKEVFHWMSLSGIRAGDTVKWEFLQPNGSIFFTNQDTFNFSGGGCAWEAIAIAGQPAAALPGNWQVHVTYNGARLLTANFTITGNTPPPPTVGAAIIIDGTDANDHGIATSTKNVRGWLYMQKALESLSTMVSPGTAKVVADLGTTSGEARRAIDSAFNLSTLKTSGWTLTHVDGAASIANWLANLSTATTGILYIPTYKLTTPGDLAQDELDAINAQATKIANFVNRGSGNGGGLFAMGETNSGSETRAWGWLRALFPGLNFADEASGSDLELTPEGIAVFPGLNDPDLDLRSGEYWHNHFTGDLGTLKVLATAPDKDRIIRNIIIGGIGIIIPSPSCPSLTGFGPTSGQAGTTVIISGRNLTGASAVRFGNNAAASFTVNSDTQITAIVPAGAATGPITLSKPTCPDTATSASFNIVSGPDRVVRVGCVSARPGGTLTLPIELIATGDENALGFSLSFDPSILSNPQIARGADATSALFNTNTSQTGQGRLGIAVALPSGQSFAAGTRQLALVTFNVSPGTTVSSTSVDLTDAPIRRQIANANAQSLTATYQGCANVRIEIITGYEADVTPRPNGKNDGSIAITDWVQVGRFAAGLDTASNGSEFQRADCAPRESKGDGQISITDWVQAGRYAAALDAPQTIGGPTAASGLAFGLASGDETAEPSIAEAAAHARPLRVVNAALQRGQTGAVAIEIEAEGDENAVGLSLEFDPAALSFVSASAGSALESPLVNVNSNQAAGGRVGIAMALPAGKVLKEGRQTLLLLRFTALASAGAASTPLRFGDQPIRRQLADANANTIAGSYENGTVNFGSPVASVSAASFKAEAAAESIQAAFGAGLATAVAIAAELPLPTALVGTTVKVKDSAGVERPAPLFFVAPQQINYLMPAGTAAGTATITITSGDGQTATGSINVTTVAPSFFTANSSGAGVPAAVLLRIKAGGEQSYEPVARYDATSSRFVPATIDPGPDLGNASDQLYLLLFGSGFRNRGNLAATTATAGGLSAEVLYAGAQGSLAGMDQINLRLPRALAGRGTVDVLVTVDGRTANPVQIAIGNALR